MSTGGRGLARAELEETLTFLTPRMPGLAPGGLVWPAPLLVRRAGCSRSGGPAVAGQACSPVTVSAAAAKAGSPVAACPRRHASTSLTWCGSRLRTAAPVSSLPGGLAG
jgi:hypothetical protein